MTSSEEFRKFGTAMVNYVADYLENIRERPVVPKVKTSHNMFIEDMVRDVEQQYWFIHTGLS